jgi:hypothetical protein
MRTGEIRWPHFLFVEAMGVVAVGWAGVHLNPHPLKADGAAPKSGIGYNRDEKYC